MSNFALSSLILLVFIFASGLALGSLARMRFNQQKRIRTGPKRPEPKHRESNSDESASRQKDDVPVPSASASQSGRSRRAAPERAELLVKTSVVGGEERADGVDRLGFFEQRRVALVRHRHGA